LIIVRIASVLAQRSANPLVLMSTGNSRDIAEIAASSFASETARASHLAFLEVIKESSNVFDNFIRSQPGRSQSVAPSQGVARNSSGTSQQGVADTSANAAGSSGDSGNSRGAAANSWDTSWSATASSSGYPGSFVGATSKAAAKPPAPRERSRSVQPWEDLQSNKYTPEQVIELRAEAEAAHEAGVRWQDRGPPGGKKGDTWRGQEFRESSQRYANRGGQHKEWYSAMYKAKKAKTLDTFLNENPKPK
jgi:hypothetical protein